MSDQLSQLVDLIPEPEPYGPGVGTRLLFQPRCRGPIVAGGVEIHGLLPWLSSMNDNERIQVVGLKFKHLFGMFWGITSC